MTQPAVDVQLPSDERAGGRRRVGSKPPRGILAVLAAWLGAVVFFGAAVAPAAFAVLPTPADAGALVGRLLPILFIAGLGVGAVLVASAARLRTAGRTVRRSMGIAGVVMIASCGLAQGWVAPQIARIRAAGSLDARSPDDPLRLSFGRLHAMSVALLGIAWSGGAATLAIGILAPHRRA